VTKGGAEVSLTLKEFELLLLFAQNPNIALYRETIYEQVWQSSYMGDSRTVDLHVQRLRRKLGWESQIEAVYKIGYRLHVM
jgi:DNA-binding response OmpR family regulator